MSVTTKSMDGGRASVHGHTDPQCGLVPGPALVAEITRVLSGPQRRPGVLIGQVPGTDLSLGVPRTASLRFFKGGGGAEIYPTLKPLEQVLRPRLAHALETEHPSHLEALTADDWRQFRHLHAAALSDLLALSNARIAEILGYYAEDAAAKAVSKGRMRWHGMAGWPWFYFGGGKPPPTWRDQGADAQAAYAFAVWRTGRIPPR